MTVPQNGFCDDFVGCPWVLAQTNTGRDWNTADTLTATCLSAFFPTGTGLCGRIITSTANGAD